MKMEKNLTGISVNDILCKRVKYEDSVGFKKIVAIIIAQLQIIKPILIVVALVISLLLFIIITL